MSPACKELPKTGVSRNVKGALPATSKVVPTNTACPGVHVSLVFKYLPRRWFKALPRSTIQCLTVPVTRKVFLPADGKLLFQYHFPASEIPLYICVFGCFLSFLLPLPLTELHCTDQLRAALVFSNPFISSPCTAIHMCQHWVHVRKASRVSWHRTVLAKHCLGLPSQFM